MWLDDVCLLLPTSMAHAFFKRNIAYLDHITLWYSNRLPQPALIQYLPLDGYVNTALRDDKCYGSKQSWLSSSVNLVRALGASEHFVHLFLHLARCRLYTSVHLHIVLQPCQLRRELVTFSNGNISLLNQFDELSLCLVQAVFCARSFSLRVLRRSFPNPTHPPSETVSARLNSKSKLRR